MTKILHIDTDIQQPNRIFKDSSNLVRQITDKSQNISFLSDSGKEPIYNYGNTNSNGYPYFEFNNKKISTVNEIVFNHNSEFSFEFWIAFTEFTNSTSGFIFQWGDDTNYDNFSAKVTLNTKIFQVCNYSINVESILGITLQTNTFYHIYCGVKDGYINAFFNGYYMGRTTNSSTNVNAKLHLGDTYNNIRPLTDTYISNLFFYDNDNIGFGSDTAPSVGTKVFNPNFKSYTIFKKYKEDDNKKLYLSSMYLKDATISNSDNTISNIRNQIGDKVLIPNSYVKLDDGFKFGDPSGAIFFNPDSGDLSDYNIGTNNFYASAWFKCVDNATEYVNILRDLSSSPNIVIYSYNGNASIVIKDGIGGEQINSASFTPTLGEWFHLAGGRKDDIIWLSVNGKLLILSTNNTILNIPNATSQLRLGGKFFYSSNICIMDDLLLSIGESIINPQGYSIGQKVFKLPQRNSLYVSEPKYNSGKYTFNEIDDMIKNKGYVPVSNTTEVNYVFTNTSTTRTMGQNTYWEGDYDGVGLLSTKNYIQVENIDYNYVSTTHRYAFSNIYDGNNLNISNTSFTYGLIESNEGVLKNIYLIDTENTGTNQSNGCLTRNNYGIIDNCHIITGSVSAVGSLSGGSRVGGLVGTNTSTGKVIKSSVSDMTIIPTYRIAGGIVGLNYGTVENCHSDVTVGSGTTTQNGGIVGLNSTNAIIKNTYAIGQVLGSSLTGGIVGQNTSQVINSYYDNITTGQSDTGKGVGKTTTQMKEGQINDSTIYTGWSLTIWGAGSDNDYPSLKPYINGLQEII